MSAATDLRGAVRAATMELAAAGVESAPVDAVLLAAFLLDVDVAAVRRRMVLGDPTVPDGYAELVARRAARIPLQHLTGQAHFRLITLAVGPGVFVPRPETELIVDHVLAELAARGGSRPAEPPVQPLVVDLGTGSGAIALSVKTEAPHVRVVAVERSAEALEWARRNRDTLGLDVALVLADAADALPELDGLVDIVVTNPPYIPDGMVPVDPEVRDFDPAAALYGGGADGLALPLAFAGRAAALLRPGGLLVMEHGNTQGGELADALVRQGQFVSLVDHADLVGRPRHLLARR